MQPLNFWEWIKIDSDRKVIVFLPENAVAYSRLPVKKFQAKFNIPVLGKSLYSTDRVPKILIYTKVKIASKGTRYQTVEAVK